MIELKKEVEALKQQMATMRNEHRQQLDELAAKMDERGDKLKNEILISMKSNNTELLQHMATMMASNMRDIISMRSGAAAVPNNVEVTPRPTSTDVPVAAPTVISTAITNTDITSSSSPASRGYAPKRSVSANGRTNTTTAPPAVPTTNSYAPLAAAEDVRSLRNGKATTAPRPCRYHQSTQYPQQWFYCYQPIE